MDSPPDSSENALQTTTADSTPWRRLADADPIEIRDPLAELLGMIPEGAPLSITFAEVTKAAGHACPAVSGAYRATQLALSELYPDSYPVRGEIAVIVGAPRDEPGYGPMANVVRHITGAADETGFVGFNGYGGRSELLAFEDRPGDGRTFEFTRLDVETTVRTTFDPSVEGIGPPDRQDPTTNLIPKLVSGDASDAEQNAFYDAWHDRVQAILQADPGPESPFTLDGDGLDR